jgi:D-alanyl-D-alanine carboxypeptidase
MFTQRRILAAAGIAVAGTSLVATSASAATLPPLNPATMRGAIAGLPSATVTGAILKVSGSAGHWSGTSGVADVRTKAPVPADGRFRIGSVTKAFTATVVLQLVAEHKIRLDESIQHYLPGLLPASLPKITVTEILDHTSGLYDGDIDDQGSDPAWYAAHRFESWTPRQIVDSATKRGLEFAPGTQQRYTGTNYYLAGMLIEKVTGHSYADEVDRRILRPLRLTATSVPGRTSYRIPGPHAHGYVTVNGQLKDVTAQSAYPWAEGGMISSAGDLTRFIGALFTGRLLPKPELNDMFTVPKVKYTQQDGNCRLGPSAGDACYSMGLMKATLPNGVTGWGKTGARPGYTTGMFATRDLSRVLVYSLNATGNKDGSESPYLQKIIGATSLGQ